MKKRCIVAAVSASLALTFLLSGCGPFADNGEETRLASQGTTQTSAATQAVSSTAEVTTQAGPPQVVTTFELNKTAKVDDFFTAGFDVKLPKIVSDKPGALAINTEIDQFRINLEDYSGTVSDIAAFTEYFKYSYENSLKNNIIFIAVYTVYGLRESEYTIDNFYYAYDYLTDKMVSNKDIGLMFSLNEAQILNLVNTALAQKGAPAVSGFDKIDLFVNANGKLVADAKVESMMGGYYSEIVILN